MERSAVCELADRGATSRWCQHPMRWRRGSHGGRGGIRPGGPGWNLAEPLDRGSAAALASGARVMARHAGCRAATAGCGADGRGASGRLSWWWTDARTAAQGKLVGAHVGAWGGARGRARRHGRDERVALDWRAVEWFITRRGDARRGCGSSVGTTSSFLTWSPSRWVGLRYCFFLVSQTRAFDWGA